MVTFDWQTSCIDNTGRTSILTNREVRDPYKKKTALSEGKNEKKSDFFCGFAILKKNIFCKKNGSKRPFQPAAVTRAIYRGLYGVATAN